MAEDRDWRFWVGLTASTVSVVGWLAAVGTALGTLYHGITGGPALRFASYLFVAIGVGVFFAQVEKRVYREHR